MEETDDVGMLSPKDEGIRRVASLALELINARLPLSAETLNARVYPDLNRKSFMTAIERDCEKLALCGMHIHKTSEPAWYIDEKNSYLGNSSITREEALELQVLLSPLVEDSGFALREELRLALLKIDRSFDQAPLTRTPKVVGINKVSSVLQQAYATHQLVTLTYSDAQGNSRERTLALYGFFGFRGIPYCVAAEKTPRGFAAARTLRISRMEKARLIKNSSYEIPDDFTVEDFIFLPFQIGPSIGVAQFKGSQAPADLITLMKSHGSLCMQEDASFVWDVAVSSWPDAAAWGIASHLVPVAPQQLREAALSILQGVVEHV